MDSCMWGMKGAVCKDSCSWGRKARHAWLRMNRLGPRAGELDVGIPAFGRESQLYVGISAFGGGTELYVGLSLIHI